MILFANANRTPVLLSQTAMKILMSSESLNLRGDVKPMMEHVLDLGIIESIINGEFSFRSKAALKKNLEQRYLENLKDFSILSLDCQDQTGDNDDYSQSNKGVIHINELLDLVSSDAFTGVEDKLSAESFLTDYDEFATYIMSELGIDLYTLLRVLKSPNTSTLLKVQMSLLRSQYVSGKCQDLKEALREDFVGFCETLNSLLHLETVSSSVLGYV